MSTQSSTETTANRRNIEPFKATSIQYNPVMHELDTNLSALYRVVLAAAKNGSKLIVTTEMVTTGYGYKSRDDIRPFVDTIPGKTTEIFADIANEYRTHIIIGMAEVDPVTDLYYNSAVLIGPDGMIGKYRKLHQWETEEHWSVWGDTGVQVFETEIGKIAMIICMDGAYMETARLAAVQGADILAFLTNSGGQTLAALQGRAEENGIYVISSNRSNTELGYHMVGASAIWSPSGEKLAESPAAPTEEENIEETTWIAATIDPTLYDNKAKYRIKNERRPQSYKDLMLHIAPWNYTKDMTSFAVNVMAFQYEPAALNKEANLEKIRDILKEKVNRNKTPFDLLVLPECCLTGKIASHTKALELSETTEGETVKEFKSIARRYGFHLVFGMAERDGDALYNTALCIDRTGEVIGKYRKIHLSKEDQGWATPGDSPTVCQTEFGRLGLMIGYDAAFPEMTGLMAVKRADVIAIPSAFNGEFGSELDLNLSIYKSTYPPAKTNSLWHAVALNAQAYTIISNFTGQHYFGGTSLYTLDPVFGLDQSVVAPPDFVGAQAFHFHTIQNHWWFNQEKLINSRRTDYYTPLVV